MKSTIRKVIGIMPLYDDEKESPHRFMRRLAHGGRRHGRFAGRHPGCAQSRVYP